MTVYLLQLYYLVLLILYFCVTNPKDNFVLISTGIRCYPLPIIYLTLLTVLWFVKVIVTM